MGTDYKPPEQGAVGKGKSLRERMQEGSAGKTSKNARDKWLEKRDEAMIEKLHRSLTRKLITGFFFVGYVVLGVHFMLSLVDKTNMIGVIWFVTWFFRAPLATWWKVEPIHVGPMVIDQIDLLVILLFAVLHFVLLQIHRAVLMGRVYVPE